MTEIKLLSAGAVKPGLVKVIDAFHRETGGEVEVEFATAPAIRRRLEGLHSVDIVIAPPAVFDELAQSGNSRFAERSALGRIGIGVMVSARAPAPKITTVDEFKEALVSAGAVVYNQASTGIYLEGLFDRLGIGEKLEAKTTRYPDAAPVLEHVAGAGGDVIGLAATTVIIEGRSKGLAFVGPLPAPIQNYTTYAAAVVAEGPGRDPALALLRYFTTSAGRAIFAAAGIE